MTIGIAILGTGRIVETAFLPAIAEVDGAKPVAVLSRTQARADSFAEAHGIANAYSDLGALLRDAQVDAVIVATPDATHEPQVIAAAKAGKHILCEKPMTTTPESAAPMAEAVRAAGVTFAMGYDNRFNPGLRRVKELIEADAIGPVRHTHTYVTTAVSNPDNWRAKGEQSRYWAMSATSTHIIDIYRWYFGDPTDVCGLFISPVFHSDKDEISTVTLYYRDRLMAGLTTAAVMPAANRIEIHGEKGSIFGEAVFGRTNREAIITCNGDRQVIPQPDPFIAEVQDFVDAIAQDRPPLAGLEDGLRNVAIMDVAWRSPSLHPVPPG
jgi:1,5-anhydro-D-fructose reductase (1,5-anhydro-D-mannitol-forming)